MKDRSTKIWQLSYWSTTWAIMPNKDRRLFGIIVLVHFLLSGWYITKQGLNFDEPDYFSYVVQWAKGNPDRNWPIMDSKTPAVAPSLVPAIFKPLLPDRLLEQDIFYYLKAGRFFMYVYQLLGMFVLLCWLYRLWGPGRWIIPLILYAYDPLIFSYGMYIGSDLPAASVLILLIYSSWRYCNTHQMRYCWMACVAAAFGVVTKASFLYVYPLLACLFIYHAWATNQWQLKKSAIRLLQFVFIQLLVINTAYYFKGTGTATGDIPLESHLFEKLRNAAPILKGIPMPLPAAFIQGIDMLQHHAEIGGCKPESTYWGVWLFDRVECNKSIWYYYVATATVKFPLFVGLLFFMFMVSLFRKRCWNKIKQHVFLWLPFVYFLLVLSLLNKFQIGIRHAILVIPFFYIGISGTIIRFYEHRKGLFLSLMLLNFISIARYWPNLIAYTNEIVWNKTKAYKLIRDSSLEYGQSIPIYQEFLKANPTYKSPTAKPDTGKFAITIGGLFAEQDGPEKNIAWLRNHFEPTANYEYTILLFEITEADLVKNGLR